MSQEIILHLRLLAPGAPAALFKHRRIEQVDGHSVSYY